MKLIVDHLTSASRTTPEQVAVICGEAYLRYAELDALSAKIAVGLESLGVSAGERVGIWMPKSMEAVAAIYAVLKVGCCYVPMGLENPPPRLAYMLENCQIRFVLAAATPKEAMGSALHQTGANVLTIEELTARVGPGRPRFDATHIAPHDAAAVLHTSGSTGWPKGAVITHANLAAFVSWAASTFALGSHDRLLSHAPFHFDLSFLDIFAAAAASAAVVLATSEDTANAVRIAHVVHRSGVTIWQSVPSALTLQAVSHRQRPEPMPSVRCVLFAGERLPRQTLLRLPDIFPKAQFYNIYGCTETNDTFMYQLPQEIVQAPEPLPIGKPLPHIRYRIVGDAGRDVEPGQQGQLWIAGATVMAGYLHSSSEAMPLAWPDAIEGSQDRFYCTNDIVSLGDDGDFYFHGRRDAIIKANGYRVNLMEIEDHLRQSKKLDEVVIFCVPDDLIGNRIIAVVKPRRGELCSTLELKLYCARALPKYAIPHRFHIASEALPKGSTGKVDKRLVALRYSGRHPLADNLNHEGVASHEFA